MHGHRPRDLQFKLHGYQPRDLQFKMHGCRPRDLQLVDTTPAPPQNFGTVNGFIGNGLFGATLTWILEILPFLKKHEISNIHFSFLIFVAIL